MAAASTEPLLGGEVAADGDAGVSGGGGDDDLRELPDQALQGTLQRMQRGVDRGIASRLPDGGRIYRLRLLAIRRELERRQAAAALSAPPPPPPSSSSQSLPPRQGQHTEGVRCEPVVHSSCTEPSDIQETSSLPAQIETAACPSEPPPDVHLIKTGPCEDSPLPAPETADDLETTPLSGDHPFFTIILSRSQVQKKFQLCIPGRFHKHLPKACTAATLICRGKSWPMSYRGDLKVKKLDTDWMDFAVDNQLQVNDACVFELVTSTKEEVVFHMQILRGGLPEEIISKGATAEKPIIVD
ncbi:B3 domain-containing protein Os04g0386900-like [Lolium rigidum]|uniref:B3 domain-containing protein Os04g0386900-like n=1 Tax=Lolium rigidum TaxID=89674 RepID=UPI001F5CB9D8|nr:B3 domain-containing protein Os04g0386900-like [Lolium rigidum]